MSLTTKLTVSALAAHTAALDLASGSVPLSYAKVFSLADGTAANQADRIFHDQRTLTASSNEDLDLAGVLTDAFGQALTFARIRALIVYAATANTNNVVVGGAATNGFVAPFGGATHTVTVRPGGLLCLIAPDTTGYVVTAATGDLLRVANSGAGTSVIYDIVLIGASA